MPQSQNLDLESNKSQYKEEGLSFLIFGKGVLVCMSLHYQTTP